MLDVIGILFSTMAVLYVVWRATKLDELYPWFDHVPDPEEGAEPRNDGRQRASLGGQGQPR
jgi:hypothetical protein